MLGLLLHTQAEEPASPSAPALEQPASPSVVPLELPVIAPAETEPAKPDKTLELLDDAVRSYMEGAYDDSQNKLATILNSPEVTDRETRIKALTFLGEVLYVSGKSEAAWDAYQNLLREYPDYTLDPFVHPPDVVAFFNTVRAATVSLRPSPVVIPTEPPAFPRVGLLPFGIYQFTHDEPIRGSLLAAGQLVTGLGSTIVFVDLLRDHSEPPGSYDRIENLRSWNWTLGGAFYGLWILGIADGAYNWRRQHGRPIQLEPAPFGLSGTF